MLSFVNFSTPDTVQYLIIDEDAFYKWYVTNDNVQNVENWLSDRETYKFKLKFGIDYSTVNIAVYKDGERLLFEEVQLVDFI